MNLTYLKENIRAARKYCFKPIDSIKYIWLLYSNYGTLHKFTREKEFQLKFVFPDPIGKVRLKLRNNKGADSFIFSELFLHNYYGLQLLQKPSTILDLGANIGLTAIFWNRTFPNSKLACVEPMPNNLDILKWNIAENKINVIVIEGAVAVKDGEVLMEIAEKDFGHQIATNEKAGQNTLKVKAFSLNTIIEKLQWPSIDLLKIDIEGYEAYLLKENCDWLYKVNYMIIELHESYLASDLCNLANEYGFSAPQEINGLWHLKRLKQA